MKYVITLVLLLTLSGCVSPAAIVALDRGIAANTNHMNNGGLPKQAREIAQDNYDLLSQVKFNLDGTPVPADTAERVEARKKAKEEAAAVEGGTQ